MRALRPIPDEKTAGESISQPTAHRSSRKHASRCSLFSLSINLTDPRTFLPGMPLAVYAGLRARCQELLGRHFRIQVGLIADEILASDSVNGCRPAFQASVTLYSAPALKR